MNVSWIDYNNKKILFADYSGCKKTEEMIKILHEYTDILRKSAEKINCLDNYENSYASNEYMEEVKKLGKEIHAEKINKNAILGVVGVKKILFNAYVIFSGQKNIKTFKTKDEALKWLTE